MQSLLQWFRNHQISSNKPKAYDHNNYLVSVKYVSVFNPVFFFQHLTMNYPHTNPNQLQHPEEDSMPSTVKFFPQAVALMPECWEAVNQINAQFQEQGHKEYFINTIVSYIMSLHNILNLWRIRVVNGQVADLGSLSMENLSIHSPHSKGPSLQSSPTLCRTNKRGQTILLLQNQTIHNGKNTGSSLENLGRENPKYSYVPFIMP